MLPNGKAPIDLRMCNKVHLIESKLFIQPNEFTVIEYWSDPKKREEKRTTKLFHVNIDYTYCRLKITVTAHAHTGNLHSKLHRRKLSICKLPRLYIETSSMNKAPLIHLHYSMRTMELIRMLRFPIDFIWKLHEFNWNTMSFI